MGNPEGTFDTTLHEAVRYGDIDGVGAALKQGYDPNLIGLYQWSALHEAAFNGDKEILELLLQKKGDPNKPDYIDGKTAMHHAAEQGHVKCLQMLVDAGGIYDIKDVNGKNSLDLATPGGCRILEKFRVRDLMLMSPSEARQAVMDDKDEGILTDRSHDKTANQSLQEVTEANSRRSSVDSQKDKIPGLGFVHISVEYHSALSTMKIRIWQLSDLLLPPPNTSMIHTIYVKSYITPDKKKETKRKTEEVKVESSDHNVHWKKRKDLTVQHVFAPASFKFNRALEYSGISSDVIKDKTLQIEVCITQRYSHRSFLIGMLVIPMRNAVKKVVKEKLALIPCMNHTIPSSMKVYSASELNITNSTSGKVFYSNPNVRVMLPDEIDDVSDKAASNPDLKTDKYSPSTEVNMNNDYRVVPVVPKLDLGSMPLDESGYSSEFHISFPGELESPDSDGQLFITADTSGTKSNIRTVDMEQKHKGKVKRVLESAKDRFSPRSKTVTKLQEEIEITDLDESDLKTVTVDSSSKVEKGVENWKYEDIKQSSERNSENSESRPDTLTWDYYDMPLEVVSTEAESTPSPWKEGASPVMLPMETTMEIHVPQSKEQRAIKDNLKDKVRKKSNKKNAQPIPGKAVPLLPTIIVTNAEATLSKKKDKHILETSVSVPEEMLEVRIDKPSKVKTNTASTSKKIRNNKNDENVNRANFDGKEGLGMQQRSVVSKTKNISQNSACAKTELDSDIKSSYGQFENKTCLPKAKPRVKKLKKVKEGGMQPDGTVHYGSQQTKVSDLSNQSSINIPSESKRPVFNRTGSETSTSNASIVLDMDSLSFTSSDSHIVELEGDISITELPDDSKLFSHSSKFSDIESGLESLDYRLPVNVSPTKYMIPMQVYTEDDTSCDESLSTDRSYIPTTEL